MLVAGVDVGNSTTELAVARLTPGAAPDFLGVWRAATTGAKGSTACAAGVSELVARAERRLGEPVHRLLLAELDPVDTGLVELGRLEELDLARNAVVRPVSETPSGAGAAGGRLRRLGELDGRAGPGGRARDRARRGLRGRRSGLASSARARPSHRRRDRPGRRRRADRQPLRPRPADRRRGRRMRRSCPAARSRRSRWPSRARA